MRAHAAGFGESCGRPQSASLNAKDTLGSAASPRLVNKWVLFRFAGNLSPPGSFPASSPSGIAGQSVLTFKIRCDHTGLMMQEHKKHFLLSDGDPTLLENLHVFTQQQIRLCCLWWDR